jgi:hypothetical protein
MRKKPWKSKTINGALLMAVSSLAPIALAKVGIVSPDAQAEVIQAVGTVAGLALTIYGRVKAKL